MGFEPMHRLPDDRISSAARYDHFDTSPYLTVAAAFTACMGQSIQLSLYILM